MKKASGSIESTPLLLQPPVQKQINHEMQQMNQQQIKHKVPAAPTSVSDSISGTGVPQCFSIPASSAAATHRCCRILEAAFTADRCWRREQGGIRRSGIPS